MKKLLLTITSALLFNFVNAGYATPVELDDLPNELKVKIIINLLPEGQKRIVQVNHSFHDNMPTAKDMMVQETAQELGLNFEEITPFCKNFLMNVRTGNFIIDEYKNHIPLVSAEMDRMVQFGRCNIVFTNSIDNNGKMETICHDREYRNLRNDHHIELRAVNPSRTIFLGVFLPGERYPDDQQLDDQQLDNQQLDRAVKYITATNQIVNLFPADSKFRSFGEGLNSDGTITVGQISENNSTYGFVHNDNGNNIFLENTPEFEQVKPVGVSDKGEIIVGSVVKNSIRQAASWLLDSDNKTYYPYLLQDLIMHYCSQAQRQILNDNYFSNILDISPNGKAMLVEARNSKDNKFYRNFTIVFGSNVEPKVEDVAVTH